MKNSEATTKPLSKKAKDRSVSLLHVYSLIEKAMNV